MREQSPAVGLSQEYPITRVEYAGGEGGIVCKVDLGPENDDRALFASITHLRFAQTGPIAREIAAYQKHRVKRLRRLGQGGRILIEQDRISVSITPSSRRHAASIASIAVFMAWVSVMMISQRIASSM